MKCYAFYIETIEQIEAFTLGLEDSHETVYWLRERFDKKTLKKLVSSPSLDRLDIAGRIFSSQWEFRYKKKGTGFRCLAIGDVFSKLLLTHGISYDEQKIQLVEERPKTLLAQSVRAMIELGDVLSNGEVKLLMHEFMFEDEATGYFLCGVK